MFFFFSSRRRHTSCALVTGVQTCALPISITRGQSLFTFEFFPDDVVALAAERFVANGMRYHTPYDALNDIRNLEVPVKAGKRAGLHVVAGLVYSHSPVHTDAYYARKAKQLVKLGVEIGRAPV